MKLYDVLVESADQAILQQVANGSFPSGHNGPYHDDETPVRNTSHWLIVLLKVYEITEDARFLNSAHKALEYIMSHEARPMNATFWHRKNPEKDFSNGLVGQAWTIEALVKAYEVFDDKNILRLAKEVFSLHPYDKEVGGWRIVNVDGSYSDFDITFNHQLWFGAVGSSLVKLGVKEAQNAVDDFMNRLNDHLKIYNNGLIRHLSPNTFNTTFKRQVYRNFLTILRSKREKKYLRMKAIGYHAFNLYAFAILKQNYPSHDLWQSQKLKKALKYIKSQNFKDGLWDNKYAFPYNPPGFESGFALQEFGHGNKDEISQWLTIQLKVCFDFEKNLMIKGDTEDTNTSAARIYEATRLNNYELNIYSQASKT